jgi:ribonuclease G
MSKEIYISSTPHETRLAIVENDALAEIYYERENEYTLAGSIYNGKVTRVLPGMQSSFVDIGLERDAFLYITDFMEETEEDSADFDGNGHSLEAARPQENGSRNGGGSGRDRGKDRGPRDQQPRYAESRPAAEPTDADLFAQAVSGLDPARPVVIEGERPERGDRGRRGGRNRGNRGGNREGRGDSVRPVEEVRVDKPETAGTISIPDSQGEVVGEGLPGADGSRRWRGRRGRRGNRGPGGAPRPDAAPVASEEPARNTGPVYDAYGAEPDEVEELTDEVLELDAAIETLPTVSEQDAFRDRSGQDRGRGGRDRERGGQRPPRAPRGFAPSADLYKVDTGEPRYGVEPEMEAPAEPIILPGESLSKYKPASEQPAAVAAPVAAPKDDFVAAGWDGGLVLPGETLRPRTAPAAYRNDAPREGRGGRDGRGDRGDHNRGHHGSRNEFARPESVAAEAHVAEPQPAPEPVSAPEPTYLTEPEHVPASHLVTPLDTTFVPPPPMPVVEAPAEPVLVEAPSITETVAAEAAAEHEEPRSEVAQEYEPSEASASYRVDPVAPREFRQSAPVLDEPELVEEPVEFVPAVEIPEELIPEQPQASHVELHGEETPEEGHEMTSISDMGNMHSELAAASRHELAPHEELEPASPIAHEGAVVEHVPGVEGIVPVAHVSHAHAPAAAYFEPGTGLLEEEVLEDDEDAFLPAVELRAEAEHHEQESLENAADLGVMLREMSIDQITRTEPAVEDDEEDFEEDFLEEDQDYDAEDEEAEGETESEQILETAAYGEDDEESEGAEQGVETAYAEPRNADAAGAVQEPRREREGGRREGRRGDRNRRPGGDRDRGRSNTGYSGGSQGGDRSRHGGGGRQSMQATNLPAISDLLKPGQEILVQIAKEPIAKKGARITSHIALPGRFLVFMPTVSHTGVSRKIESDGERRRLKEILLSEKGEAPGGFIVRTAAAGASEEELRSDLRFLLNLWTDIKTRSESSKSPALIYHDLNLIERVLRDQVTDNFSAIWVDTETEYERVLRFLQRFQPSLIRRVKLYTKETPMYEQFGITEEINKALRSKVWLKSGGSIVINQTEALVAIDINTGKFVGKTARLEDTIVKTNLDAIPEIVRQIRLRDLGGIIIIDFIDMDERKNRNKVMAALEEELKLDRAPSKVLQFNDFGLVAITRKRVKQSLERTLSTTCTICQGTGMVKSPVTVCNDIYVEMRKMAKHLDRGDVMLRVHPDVVKQLKAPQTHWLQEMEEMVGKTILIKSDPGLHPEQFDIH